MKGNKLASLALRLGQCQRYTYLIKRRVTVVVVGLVLVVVPGRICSYVLTKQARLLLKQRHKDRLR